MYHLNTSTTIPCAKCSRGRRNGANGQWTCSQPGFRPRPVGQVTNCTSLNSYLRRPKSRH